jgi:serine/threonine protein kinase/tetratricopeptide (TPR) repeat protein
VDSEPYNWKQVESLFYEALELPAAERHAFLEAACDRNSELLREVQSLLASSEGNLDEWRESVQAAATAVIYDRHASLAADGTALGPYKIISKLGAGGMGEVYLAEDTRLGRRVALKLLKPAPTYEPAGAGALQAHAASALNHPNIVTVYEFGEYAAFQYMATEFADGPTLRQICSNGSIEISSAVEVAIQIARALTAAHAAGIIHRDIKPENVIVRTDGVVKVLDFGIAKLTESTRAPIPERRPTQTGTIPGTVMGTVKYMSPEQARGVTVDGRSDIFSLGSVIYEMAAGRAPFEGGTDSDLIAEILKTEPPPLSTIAPQAPVDLQRIVTRAMQKERGLRYNTAEELVADLCAFRGDLEFKARLMKSGSTLAGSGIHGTLSDPRSQSSYARFLSTRFPTLTHSTGYKVTALLFVVAILALGWFARYRMSIFHPPSVASATRTIAVLPFRNLTNDPQSDFLSFSLADAVTTKLGYVNTLVVRPSSSVEKYRDRAVDARKVASDLKVNTLLTGSYMREGDLLRINAQLIDVGADRLMWQDTIDLDYNRLLSVQDKVTEEIINGLQLKLSPSEERHLQTDHPSNPLAYETYLRGVDLYALGDYGAAIRMLERSATIDPTYGLTWAHLGRAYTTNATLQFGGREQYSKAKAAYQRALSLDSGLVAVRVYEANLLTDTGQVEQAVPLLREALAASPNNAEAHWELGYAYRFAGFLPESIVEGERARALDPEVKINSSAMNSYLYIGDYDRFLSSLPASNAVYVIFYRGFGEYYKNDFKDAVQNFEQAFQVAPDLLPSQIGKSLSYKIQGKPIDGLKLLHATELRIEERGVNDAESVYKVAQAYAVLGDKPSALRILRRSIEGGFFCYPYLRDDPLTQSLREEPEFRTLLGQAEHRHLNFEKEFMLNR